MVETRIMHEPAASASAFETVIDPHERFISHNVPPGVL